MIVKINKIITLNKSKWQKFLLLLVFCESKPYFKLTFKNTLKTLIYQRLTLITIISKTTIIYIFKMALNQRLYFYF